ncbi:MAG: hypothetical protein KJ574_01675 [Nanoarchaeota archaeon]|nr:hypothetical protein [Nanoarchaeota archaeon]
MEAQIKKTIRKALGIICLAIGFIGFFIPILQGWFFILLGLALLEIDFIKKKLQEWKAKRKKD